MFCFFFLVRECYKDKCWFITWEHKAAGVTTVCALISGKPAEGIKPQMEMLPGKRSYRVNVLEDLSFMIVTCVVLWQCLSPKVQGEKRMVYFPFSTLCSVEAKKTFLPSRPFFLSELTFAAIFLCDAVICEMWRSVGT